MGNRIEKPFLDCLVRPPGNFTRVETFVDNQGNGTNDVTWLKVLVDARSREVFAFQTQIVPASLAEIVAPTRTRSHPSCGWPNPLKSCIILCLYIKF